MTQRKKNNIILGSLCAVVLLMAVGYAAFSSILNIKGTSTIGSNWNILITNVTSKNIVGSASNEEEPSWKNLTATFKTNLVSPGDSIEYDITIENRGNLNAKLDKITLTDSNNPAIKFTSSGLEEGSELNAGESQVLTVKVEYDNNVTTQPENTEGTFTVTLDYSQKEGSGEGPGEDTFTGTIYRNNIGHYLVNGKSINETIKVYYSLDYSSVEEANGDFYINELDCISDKENCTSEQIVLSVGDYVENPSNLGKFYLKHVIENDILMESYVCFVTDTEHCMKGGNASYYAANRTLLQGQDTWFANNGISCNFSDSTSLCRGDGLHGINALSNGVVSVRDSAFFGCYVHANSDSGCTQWSF